MVNPGTIDSNEPHHTKGTLYPSSQVVASQITAVTVYTDQARVVRCATLTLTGQEQELILEQLPLSLQPESVRVYGRGTVSVQLRGVRTERVYAIEPVAEKVAQLTLNIEQLEQQQRGLEDSLASLNLQQTFVEALSTQSISSISRSLAQQKMGLTEIGEVVTFLGQRHGKFAKAIALHQQQKKQLEKQLQALRQQLKQIQSPHPQESYTVYIDIEVSQAGAFDLEVEYACHNAHWTPLYDLSVSSKEQLVNLTYLAQIQQNTGEDWVNCALTLSTAKPGLGTLPPKLEPWYIDILRPPSYEAAPAPMMMRSVRMRKTANGEDNDEEEDEVLGEIPAGGTAFAAEMVEAETITTQVTNEGGVVTFQAGNNNIPGDGISHKITIFSDNYPCRLEYIAMPKKVSFAYLQAIVTNPTHGATLLPGQANLFRDQRFVGTTTLDNIAPGQEFKINLGIDEGLNLSRDLVERDVDKRFLGGQRRTTYAYRLTITNLLAQSATLNLIEQLPVSRHEQVKVRLTKSTPTIQTGEMGKLEWTLTLQANTTQTIYYQFVIETPKDLTVTNLNV